MNFLKWLRKKMCESGAHNLKPVKVRIFINELFSETKCNTYEKHKCTYCKFSVIQDYELHRNIRPRKTKTR